MRPTITRTRGLLLMAVVTAGCAAADPGSSTDIQTPDPTTSTGVQNQNPTVSADVQSLKPHAGELLAPKIVTIDHEAIEEMRQIILNNGIYKRVPDTQAKVLSAVSAAAATTGATMAFPMKDPRAACPGGYVYYFQDDEDNSTGSQMELYQDDVTNFTIQTKIAYDTLIPFLSAGGIEFPRIPRNHGTNEESRRDTQITFCREWVDVLPQNAKNSYVVISADGNCPRNSSKFVRRIDNEDTGNKSFVEPNNLPGIVVNGSGDSTLTMCYVPRNPYYSNIFPNPYAQKYWFFSNASAANYRGSQFIDNEDNGNANAWTYSSDSTLLPLVKAIMGDGVDTHWYFAGLDDGYAPLVFLTKHSARYAAEVNCANARDTAYSDANRKGLGTAATTALATTTQDWTALKGTVTGWTDYAGAFLGANTAYDNCMSQAQLIAE